MELNRQKIILGLSIAVAIETGISSGTVSLTNVFPAHIIPYVVGWCGLLGFIGSTIIASLTGSSIMSTPAPKAVATLALGALIALFAMSGHAEAQKLTGDIARDFGPRSVSPLISGDPFQDLMNQFDKVKAEQIAGIVAALQEADDDASQVINATTGDVKDPVSHACYPAQIKFLQSLPVSQSIKAPAPYNLIVLFQRKRDFVAQIKAGLPSYLKVGCAALLGDEIKTFVNTLAMVGVKILPAAATAMFPAIAPITLPAMSLVP